MLLSLKQRYVVDVLDKLSCIRRDQLYLLTRDAFKTEDYTLSESQMDAALKNLPHLVSGIRAENGLVRYESAVPDTLRLEAIDVMLELSNGYPIKFCAVRDATLLLRFSLGCDPPRQYTVACYSESAAFLNEQRNIVWISEQTLSPESITLASHQFYAQRREDGSHRFFGAGKS